MEEFKKEAKNNIISKSTVENDKIKNNNFLEQFKHDDSLSKEVNEKIHNNVRFSLYCLFFLTECFFRLCNIIQNFEDKKIFSYDAFSSSFANILNENAQYMVEKKQGLIRFRQHLAMNKKKENYSSLKRGSQLIHINQSINLEDCYALNQRDLYELLLKLFPNEEKICQDICFFIKKYEILSFFLKLDQIQNILKEMLQGNSFENLIEIIKRFQNTAFQELMKELLNIFENYQNFIQKIKSKSESLVLEILYYKPEFQIENINQTTNLAYFENENFKKAINNRISLYRQIYGIKKNMKSIQRINFNLNSAIKNFEEEKHEKENEEEEIFLKNTNEQIKKKYNKKNTHCDRIGNSGNSSFEKKKEKRRTLSFVIQGYKDLLIKKEELRKYEKQEILRQKKSVSFESSIMALV